MTWTRTIRVVSTGTVTLNTRPSAARTGTAMAVGSIICVQAGLALSVPLFGQIGPLGAVWLRLTWAAVVLLVVIRPRPWRFRRPILLATVVLGVVTAGVTILFMEAVARLPLGTATALITHNAPIAEIADRVVTLADGRVHSERRVQHRRKPSELSW